MGLALLPAPSPLQCHHGIFPLNEENEPYEVAFNETAVSNALIGIKNLIFEAVTRAR